MLVNYSVIINDSRIVVTKGPVQYMGPTSVTEELIGGLKLTLFKWRHISGQMLKKT